MRELVLQIPETDFEFFIALLKKLSFVKVVPATSAPAISAEKLEVLRGIKQALGEVQMIRSGELPKLKMSEILAETD